MTEPGKNDQRSTSHLWWSNAIVYQLYPRSFADSNGDGSGDLEGIRQHLDHLRDLGVNAIWLSPCFPSPQRDHGYDVADYFDIEPAYGTLADFDRLVGRCQGSARSGSCSTSSPTIAARDHAWFQAALKAAPGSPERLATGSVTARAPTATSRPTTGGRSSVARHGRG